MYAFLLFVGMTDWAKAGQNLNAALPPPLTPNGALVFIQTSVNLSIYLSIYLYIYLYLSINLSLPQPLSLSLPKGETRK